MTDDTFECDGWDTKDDVDNCCFIDVICRIVTPVMAFAVFVSSDDNNNDDLLFITFSSTHYFP